MVEKKSFYEKVKEHKTEIIIAGVTIISIAGAVLIAKSWDLLKKQNVDVLLKDSVKTNDAIIPFVPEAVQNVVVNIPPDGKVIDVSKHIRNLPKGWMASSEKLDSAIENGVVLGANQTWVDTYSKLCA